MEFFLGITYNAIFIIAYLLKIISNQNAKKKVVKYFFKNKNISLIENSARAFVENQIDNHLKHNVIKKLKWHQEQNHVTVLISASLGIYVKPWAKKYNFDFIEATELVSKNEKFTGEIHGKNCYGIEKVKRLNKIFNNSLNNYQTYGYGDSSGDEYFLKMCDFKYNKKELSKINID